MTAVTALPSLLRLHVEGHPVFIIAGFGYEYPDLIATFIRCLLRNKLIMNQI